MKRSPVNCKNCNEIFYGRSNKIFCDSNCRSDFHNRRRQIAGKLMDVKSQKNQIQVHLNEILKIVEFDKNEIKKRSTNCDKQSIESTVNSLSLLKNNNIQKEVKKIQSVLANLH